VSQSIFNTLLLVASIGAMVGINLMIAGLIVIAVIHDGPTATAIASTFQQILQSAITALGMLLSGLITGRIILSHTMARNDAEREQLQIPLPGVSATATGGMQP
jgi:hypothetical protein